MGDSSCYGLVREIPNIIFDWKGEIKNTSVYNYHPYYNPMCGYIDLYNEWIRETYKGDVNPYEVKSYKCMEKLHPYEKMVLAVSVMRWMPFNNIYKLFITTCPLLLNENDYNATEELTQACLDLWDNKLNYLATFEIYRLSEYLIKKQSNKEYKANSFIQNILKKINYEKLDSII